MNVTWYNSPEILSRLVSIAQVLMLALTAFTIWGNVQRGNIERKTKAKWERDTQNVTDSLKDSNTGLVEQLEKQGKEMDELTSKVEPRKLSRDQREKLRSLLPKQLI